MSIRLYNNSGGYIDLNAGGTGTAANTFTLPAETGTLLTTASTVVYPKGGPTFYAYLSGSAQSVTSSTYTKMALNAELWDTDNAFDSSTNYRFQPSVAGYYQLNARIIPATSTTYTIIVLYKNGSSFAVGFSGNNTTNAPAGVSCIMYLNGSTDYAEVYGYITGTSPTFSPNSDVCYFNGALVRAA